MVVAANLHTPHAARRPRRTPLTGQRLGGYRLLELLGEGSMGAVYRATHVVRGGEYAVKVIHEDLASDPKLVRRLQREADVVRTLRHPNVVALFEYARSPEGRHFLVMELLRGPSLAEVIADRGALGTARAGSIARQVALGLDEAHRVGFVHRDLKPDNVMLVEENGAEVAKVLDFGVCLDLRQGTDVTQITMTGNLLGTPTYIAPEQIFHTAVGPKADLYALGVILYEMLAGTPPFTGGTVEVLSKHNAQPPPPLPPCAGLEALVEQMLAKKPEARPESGRAIAEEIQRLLARPESIPAPAAFTDPIRPPPEEDAPTLRARLGSLPSTVSARVRVHLRDPRIAAVVSAVATGVAAYLLLR